MELGAVVKNVPAGDVLDDTVAVISILAPVESSKMIVDEPADSPLRYRLLPVSDADATLMLLLPTA